ncbi:hypothetical protein [Microbulbifer sp. TYP-18]|uniref:hypothetical protein n=1 Tax=Microbulbifer sp. TYP-18 TaxID=3230024 RepID=UPI0034C66372
MRNKRKYPHNVSAGKIVEVPGYLHPEVFRKAILDSGANKFYVTDSDGMINDEDACDDSINFLAAPDFIPVSAQPEKILCDITGDKKRLCDTRKMWLMAGERFVICVSDSDISVARALIRFVDSNVIKGAIILRTIMAENLQSGINKTSSEKAVSCLPYRDMLHLRLLLEAVHPINAVKLTSSLGCRNIGQAIAIAPDTCVTTSLGS